FLIDDDRRLRHALARRRSDRLVEELPETVPGGERGRMLDQGPVQTQVDRFLNSMELVDPGIGAPASRRVVDGSYVAHREHWASNPRALGSYACYFPGQFSTIAGLEGVAAGLLKFAASTLTRSILTRGSWKAAASPGFGPPTRSWPISRPVGCNALRGSAWVA